MEVTHKWQEFGLAVGLTDELLEKYSAYPAEECIVEVLDVWLRNYDCSDSDTNMTRKPTWWDVAKALRDIELHQLANDILSKYKNGKSLANTFRIDGLFNYNTLRDYCSR